MTLKWHNQAEPCFFPRQKLSKVATVIIIQYYSRGHLQVAWHVFGWYKHVYSISFDWGFFLMDLSMALAMNEVTTRKHGQFRKCWFRMMRFDDGWLLDWFGCLSDTMVSRFDYWQFTVGQRCLCEEMVAFVHMPWLSSHMWVTRTWCKAFIFKPSIYTSAQDCPIPFARTLQEETWIHWKQVDALKNEEHVWSH